MVKKEKYEPDQYKEIKPYKSKPAHNPKRATSFPVRDVNISPKLRERSAPHEEDRHEPFQFGTNPMEMTNFEKELVEKEKAERCGARNKYIAGVQGRDGGAFPREQFDSEYPDKF